MPRQPRAVRKDARPADATRRRSVELNSTEALRLLGSIPLGRIVFTLHALPAIRPVNHIVDDGDIVIRTHEGTALTTQTRQAGAQGVVVAYEADDIDHHTRLGWSVVATGYCRLVTDPRDVARYRILIHPWPGQQMDYVVRFHPDLITGVRLAGAG
ncbi:pyridoxamine 5'-phosphate oxidase family protein [Streptomyces gilvosporeus]|uniref:Pyridoxamine 5'-phosphate oxidase n=1 Tax=Streptomyces gilvosporeus TaxID=553510 RepID=A0A1V0TZG2_9ACTN|nr:pyridoxamine 5'-phosphate oxidase family protein [Streptomyces gilvosporeus]ARF58062.1 pyridoxamine 5'-phosphate oxidase [Streptomyces gilvosporeus]